MLRFSLGRVLACLLFLQPLSAFAGQWTESTVPTVDGEDVDLKAVFVESGTRIFAVGRTDFPARGVIFQGDGNSWTPVHVEAESNHGIELYDVWSGGGSVFVVGESIDFDTVESQPFVLQSSGNGFTRTNLDAFGEKLRGIWGRSAGEVFAVGTGLTSPTSTLVLRFDGNSWTPLELPESNNNLGLTEVWGTATDLIVMGCCDQLRFDGTNWTLIFPEPFGIWNGLWGTAISDVYAVGWDNFALEPISVFYDGTASSTMFSQGAPTGLNNPFEDVWAHPSLVVAVGSDSVYRLTQSGWVEEAVADSTTLLGIHGSADGTVYAVGRNRVVLSMQIPTPTGVSVTGVSGQNRVDGQDLPPDTPVALNTGSTIESDGEVFLSCENTAEAFLILFTDLTFRFADVCARSVHQPLYCDGDVRVSVTESFILEFLLDPGSDAIQAIESACTSGTKGAGQGLPSVGLTGGPVRVDATGTELGVELVGTHATAVVEPGGVVDARQAAGDGATVFAAVAGPVTVIPENPELDPMVLEPDFQVAVEPDQVLAPVPTVLFYSSFEGP